MKRFDKNDCEKTDIKKQRPDNAWRRKWSYHVRFASILINTLMVFFVLIIIVPMLNLFVKTMSDPEKVPYMNGYQIWPSGVSFIHYNIILGNSQFWIAMKNSMIVTITGTALSIILTCSAAYVLTRPDLPGEKAIIAFLIVLMIIEPSVIQEYFVMKSYGLLNKLASMVFHSSVSVYYLIVLMRFFSETPQAFLDAAKVDGAGEMITLFKIFLPINRVPIITIGMFYIVPKWNEYFRSGIFLTDKSKMLLQVFLRVFVVDGQTGDVLSGANTMYNNLQGINMSALKNTTIVIALVPILLLYPLILKYFASGVLTGGIKE